MTNERLKKILVRCTVFIMCLHAFALLGNYGFSIPAMEISYQPPDHSYAKVFAISRWFDLLMWPIFSAIYFFIFCAFKAWAENKTPPTTATDLFKLLSFLGLSAFSFVFFVVGMIAVPCFGIIGGLLFGSFIGLVAGMILSGVLLLVALMILIVILALRVLDCLNIPEIKILDRIFAPVECLVRYLSAEEKKKD